MDTFNATEKLIKRVFDHNAFVRNENRQFLEDFEKKRKDSELPQILHVNELIVRNDDLARELTLVCARNLAYARDKIARCLTATDDCLANER